MGILKDIFTRPNTDDMPWEWSELVVALEEGTRQIRPLSDFVHYIECEYCGSRMPPERYDCEDCGAPLPIRKVLHMIQKVHGR